MNQILKTVLLTSLWLRAFATACNADTGSQKQNPPTIAQSDLVRLKNDLFTLHVNLGKFENIPTNNNSQIWATNEVLLRDLGGELQQVGASDNFIGALTHLIDPKNPDFNRDVNGFVFPFPGNAAPPDVSSNFTGAMFAAILYKPDHTLNTILKEDLKTSKMTWTRICKLRKNISTLGFELTKAGIIAGSGSPMPDEQLANEGGIYPLTSITDTNGSERWLVSFSSGAQFLNPFVIEVPSGATTGKLTNNGSSTVGYLQFDVMRRWVLAPTFSTDPSKTFRDGFFWNDWDPTPDAQFDVGFYFANSANSSTTTYSAQTLAGSDIYMNLLLAEQVFRNSWQSWDNVAFQASLGGSIGAATEHTFEQIHPNYFAGLILDAGIPNGFFQDTNVTTRGLAEFRIGAGHVQYPLMTGTGNQVNLNGNSTPQYHGVWSPEMSANILVPFGKVYLNVEANAFISNQTPNEWNVKVGVTIPWATIGKELSFLGLGGS